MVRYHDKRPVFCYLAVFSNMFATMYVHRTIDMVKGHESVNQTSAATKRQGIPTINSVRVKNLVTTSLHILGEETLNG